MSEMSNGEIGRQLTEMKLQMAQGFTGVNTRLDRVNGRLDTQGNSIASHAVRLAEHGVKITNLNREVFARDEAEPPAGLLAKPVAVGGDDDPITMRQLKRVAWVIGVLFIVIEWLPRLVMLGRQTS